MATARLDMRLDKEIKERAEKASALLGMKSLTEYVVKLMDEHSEQVIAEHAEMTLKNDVFDRFMSACENAQPPNKALRDAKALSKELGIR